jgi:hypothetical protein
MRVDVRAHLDFFDFDGLLLLARFRRFLLTLVFQLPDPSFWTTWALKGRRMAVISLNYFGPANSTVRPQPQCFCARAHANIIVFGKNHANQT